MFASAIIWGGFIEIAESMFTPGVTNPRQPAVFPKGWKLVKNINAEAVAGLVDRKEFMGFVAQSIEEPNTFAVLLRGTRGLLDILEDFDFDLVDFDMIGSGGQTEHGFTRFYESFTFVDPASGISQSLEEYVKALPPAACFTVAGYSLGGALGTLHAAVLADRKLPVNVYTFASPMVGNAAFVNAYNLLVQHTCRIANIPDIIPKLPGTFLGYQHVTAPFLVDSRNCPEIGRNIYSYHSLNAYLYALRAFEADLGP